MSEITRKEVVRRLFEWQAGQRHYTACLFDLYAKADFNNRAKLSKSYPVEASVYDEWQASSDPEEMKRKYES